MSLNQKSLMNARGIVFVVAGVVVLVAYLYSRFHGA